MGKFTLACKRTVRHAKSLWKGIAHEGHPRKGNPIYIICYWSIVAGLTPVIASGLIVYVVAEVHHFRGDDDFTHLLENDELNQEIA